MGLGGKNMENLKALRNARNINQKALGETLGVSQQAIYKYEHSLAEPDIYTLIQLASFFNTSVDYLIGNTDNPERYEKFDLSRISQEEATHLRHYRRLTSCQRRLVDEITVEFTGRRKDR